MVPVNTIVNDPLLHTQLAQQNMIQRYNQSLGSIQTAPIWAEIDRELSTLTELQTKQLFYNESYVNISSKIQELVSSALLESVKVHVENTPTGRELLTQQLQLLKTLKVDIINNTSKELELLQRFKEYSKDNPNITYQEFLNSNNHE